MFKRFILVTLASLFILPSSFIACQGRDKNIGTEKNPIKISFMPSAAKEVMDKESKILAKSLSKNSGMNVIPELANNYISIIDAFGTKQIDVAFINSLGYLLAHDWAGSNAIFQLKGVDGKDSYESAIIVNKKSGIKDAKELNGKSFAYTDPFSMAGYLAPLAYFTKNKIAPSSTTFTNGYAESVKMVYDGMVDGAAIYYHAPDPYGRVRDARSKLIKQHEDTLNKIEIITIAGKIPNTPIVFRKGLAPEVKAKLIEAFKKSSKEKPVIKSLSEMYDATGILPANEKEFDAIRDDLKTLGKSVEEVVPGGVSFFRKHIWENAPDF